MTLADAPLDIDALTGLATRRAFQVRAAAILADPAAAPAALILADIDDCKRFNGCHGHVAGDALIVALARLCLALSRPGDAVARIGGETIAWLAPRTSLAQAAGLAERARGGFAATRIATDEGERSARMSAGVALAAGPDLAALIAAAEASLYEAKRAGKNRVVLAPH